jgi:N6-L-threonylcarbamoyladenine synthase
MLGLPFPAGKHLDALSREGESKELFRVKCPELEFSLSGVQNKVQQYHESHCDADTACYALKSVCYAVKKSTENALKQYPGLEVVFSGGVASNGMLRQEMAEMNAVFSDPQFSTDNAMGVAILAHRLQEG